MDSVALPDVLAAYAVTGFRHARKVWFREDKKLADALCVLVRAQNLNDVDVAVILGQAVGPPRQYIRDALGLSLDYITGFIQGFDHFAELPKRSTDYHQGFRDGWQIFDDLEELEEERF